MLSRDRLRGPWLHIVIFNKELKVKLSTQFIIVLLLLKWYLYGLFKCVENKEYEYVLNVKMDGLLYYLLMKKKVFLKFFS